MSREHYIAGDWGTSRLRLTLCRAGQALETRQGPGIGALREPAAATLRPLIAGWRETYGPLPLVLCGMAGSRNGWRETAYLPCPADPRALGEAALRFEADDAPVATAPGREAVLIGDVALNQRYAQALRRESIAASCLDGEQCALAGLHTLWRA